MFVLFPKYVVEASYAWKLKKPIIYVRMQPDFYADGWLGFILGNSLYIDMSNISSDQSDDEINNMEKLIKGIGNKGRISCHELDGMHTI